MKHQIITILLIALLGLSCFTVKSEPYTQPTENDYHVGEKMGLEIQRKNN
jgi:hypothetical protein